MIEAGTDARQDEAGGLDRVPLADEAATLRLGARIAAEIEPGDLIALHGEIGAGKTTLARAILRAHLGDPGLEVPSPTFTLMQTYDGPRGAVVHADLYRIARESDLFELGFDEGREEAAWLVEWPDRAPQALNRPRLDVALSLDAASGEREAVLSGSGPLVERLQRALALDAMLRLAGWGAAERSWMGGDASSRAYIRLTKSHGATALVMISPPRPDGPPVRRGKPYSAIARLAESVHAFVAMDRGLLAEKFSAPRILAEDLASGLLLIEDFGAEPVINRSGPILERYAEATRLLAALHARALPSSLPVAKDRDHVVPPYDLDAFLIETELLLDWYCPDVAGIAPSGSVRAEFGHVWRELLADSLAGPQTWTLRDYHSPNLIWLPKRQGLARVGLLDFQDAVMGPPAYDVASLLQDARVTVPAEMELKLLGIYAAARRQDDPDFDMAAFATAYAVMAAQRATKILGIFARLNRRDGKPQYLAHLPRIRAYLARNLGHPALNRLKTWYGANLKADFAEPAPPPEPALPEASAASGDWTAMVLAAGLGSRMRPITDTVPKPLVSVGSLAMIDHVFGRLREAGIGKAVVNVHHLADRIEGHLLGVEGIAVDVSDERDALLETGGGVKRALPRLGHVFLVVNSDSLWTGDAPQDGGNVGRLLAAWRPDAMDALLLLAPRESLGYDGRGDFVMSADGRLARRARDGTAPFVYAGVAILKAASFADTPEGAFSLNLIFDRAIAADGLYGLMLDGEWLHVGTPEAIGAAEERVAAASR